MALEWDKINSDPTKGYKILGQNLLQVKVTLEIHEKNIAELTTTRNELMAKLDSVEKKITNLESALNGKDEKITSLEDTINGLNNKLTQVKDEADNSVNELKKHHEEQLETKNQKILELENSISNTEAEIKLLKEDLAVKNNTISELQNEKSAIQNTIPELEDQLAAKSSEIENLKQDMTAKTSNEEIEIKSGKSQLDELQGQANTFKEEVKRLREEVKTKDDILKEKDRKMEALEKKIERMTTEIKELKEQIPQKIVFEKAEEVIKGAACPNCGIPTYEEYKTVKGARCLIRKYCSNPACGWTFAERPEIAIVRETEVPKEAKKELKIFSVKKDKLEAVTALTSKMVAIIADPIQEIVWIWRGKDSDRFEYAEATRHAAKIKSELIGTPHARLERVEEGKEPENFPTCK